MHKLITSNVTISLSSSASLGHLIKNSKLPQRKLLMFFKKTFNSVSINRLRFLFGHLGPPTIDLSLR